MKAFTLILLMLMLVFHDVAVAQDINTGVDDGVVVTPVGKVLGLKMTAVNGKAYWSFRGIPYALPPVRELRFTRPQPFPKQDDVIDATKDKPACIQDVKYLSPTDTASEDCLFLNIFTNDKTHDPTSPKKVLFYIHGGGFVFGSASSYNPGSLVTDHDIIVVIIQYRLGVLGFFTTQNEAAQGNYGLWDQTLALRWVKFNIAAFGGDPDGISIVGESAGAASVSLLTLSPVTRGLFTRAYSSSGVATSLFAQNRHGQNAAVSLAKYLDCFNKDYSNEIDVLSSRQIVACLRYRPESDFLNVQLINYTRPIFVPWADGELIPKSPSALIRDNGYLEDIGYCNRKYLYSINNKEQSVFSQSLISTKDAIFNNNSLPDEDKTNLWGNFSATLVHVTVADRLEKDNLPTELPKKVLDWYKARITSPNDVLDLITDANFVVPTFDMLKASSRGRCAESWLLYFNHYPHYLRGEFRGMLHALGLAYLFDGGMGMVRKRLAPKAVGEFGQDDVKLKTIFQSVVASFVKIGNPGTALLGRLPGGWPTFDATNAYYLDLAIEPTIQRNLKREVRKLWEKDVPTWEIRRPDNVHTEL